MTARADARRAPAPPQQARSRERVARIVDAAEQLLGDEGYDAVTIRRLAEVAEVPTGTIYRFFADKQAVVDVLAQRYLDTFGTTLAALVHDPDAPALQPGRLVATLLGTFVELYRGHPGYRALWAGRHLSPALLAADATNNAEIAATLADLLVRQGVAAAGGATLAAACHVAVLAADAVLQEAFRADPAGDPALLAQAHVLLAAYLATLVEPATSTADARRPRRD